MPRSVVTIFYALLALPLLSARPSFGAQWYLEGRKKIKIEPMEINDFPMDVFLKNLATATREKEAWFKAVRRGRTDIMEKLLDSGFYVNAKNSQGSTALLIAALRRKHNLMSFLLDKGAAINVLDDAGNDPLMIAVLNGDAKGVEILLDGGAGGHGGLIADVSGYLHNALLFKKKGVAKLLITRGIGLDGRSKRGGELMLLAAMIGDVSLGELLIRSGVGVNALNDRMETPLVVAASRKNKAFERFLIANGADVGYENRNGEAEPLITASKNRRKS